MAIARENDEKIATEYELAEHGHESGVHGQFNETIFVLFGAHFHQQIGASARMHLQILPVPMSQVPKDIQK